MTDDKSPVAIRSGLFVICHFESRAGDHEGGFFHDGFAKPGGIVVRGVRGKSLEER